MNEQARKEFEVLALVLAPKHYRYAQSDMAMKTFFERRTDGSYACDWVDGAWLGYQAGIEANPMISIGPVDFDRLYGQYPEPLEPA